MVADWTKFRDAHKGEKILVLGCGPSKKQVKGTGLRMPVIATNDAACPTVWPTLYQIAMDNEQRLSYRLQAMLATKCNGIFLRKDSHYSEKTLSTEGVHLIEDVDVSTAMYETLWPVTRSGSLLASGYTTVIPAISLAVYMGASEIGVLGFDHNDLRHSLGSDGWRKKIDKAVLHLLLKSWGGVHIYNLSQQSNIQSLPRMRAEDFFKEQAHEHQN